MRPHYQPGDRIEMDDGIRSYSGDLRYWIPGIVLDEHMSASGRYQMLHIRCINGHRYRVDHTRVRPDTSESPCLSGAVHGPTNAPCLSARPHILPNHALLQGCLRHLTQ